MIFWLYWIIVFGMTEAGGCIIAPICDANKIGSCGQPISRSLAKVVDINTGEALGPNEEGELCIYGPNVMKGYYKNEKATRDTIDSDGWLHSGDIATYDEDGQFFIVDRLKELIKVKGLQVATRLWCALRVLIIHLTFLISTTRFYFNWIAYLRPWCNLVETSVTIVVKF